MRFVSEQGYASESLDLNEHLIKDPAATYLLRVEGEAMIGAGIYDGDELVVDRSLNAADGNVVVAAIDGELVVRRLQHSAHGVPELRPENPAFPTIRLTQLEIWGVVTRSLHRV